MVCGVLRDEAPGGLRDGDAARGDLPGAGRLRAAGDDRRGADGAGVPGQGRGHLRLQQGPLSELLWAATLGIIIVEPSVGDILLSIRK